MADGADQVAVGGNSEGSLVDGIVTRAECEIVARVVVKF